MRRLLVTVCCVASLLFLAGISGAQEEPADGTPIVLSAADLEGLPVRGAMSAKVELIEFADFQCPACALSHAVIEESIYPDYRDKVAFYYWPVSLPYHEWARPAAVAALCMARSDPKSFCGARDYFFSHQDEISADEIAQYIHRAALAAGVTGDAIRNCAADRGLGEKVDTLLRRALSLGLQGTPSIAINGRMYMGVRSREVIEGLLNDALNSAGNADDKDGTFLSRFFGMFRSR